MGYYTRLNIKIKLSPNTPPEIINALSIWTRFGGDEITFDHELFKCRRWLSLFCATNGEDIKGGELLRRGNYWVLDLEVEFKDCDCEISKFVDWIHPYVAGRKKKQYIGYYQGEDQDSQCNLYVER